MTNMNTPPLQSQAEQFECRFLLHGTASDDVFHDALAADVRAARLPPAFRAYYRLRSFIPLRVRQLLQRHRRIDASPRWCYPDRFVAALAESIRAAGGRLTVIHPWPDGAQFAFVLTHDVETADGIGRVEKIAALEEELGFRSSWNFVPNKYSVDRGLVRDLTQRGFELGVHGYNHDGRLFTSRGVFNRRLPAIHAALEAWGAVGFRAPMVHRNLAWMQSLQVDYDASCFDADPYQAMPGGVGGVWPFMAGRFVELPYTLPQDHTLFVALEERDEQTWLRKLEYIIKLCGMALAITHPDYLDSDARLDAYHRLLERAREIPLMWHALPKDVAAWWRDRDQSTLRHGRNCLTILGPAASRGRAAVIQATVKQVHSSDQPTIEWRAPADVVEQPVSAMEYEPTSA
jgi:hypothetical protein